MIGKAIHNILKEQISDLATGGIYPIIMPQNAKYSVSDSSSYPAVIYQQITDYETSKDKNPNMIKCDLSIQVISKSYKTTNEIASKIKDVMDNYKDFTRAGLSGVQGFTDNKGNNHSYIKNIDISNVFFTNEEDDYYDDLFLFTRAIDYDIYYYYNIEQFDYNKGVSTISNPLMLSLDCTQVKNNNTSALIFSGTEFTSLENTELANFIYNKTGKYYAKETPTSSRAEYNGYLTTEDANRPKYYNATNPAYLQFEGTQYLRTYDSAYKNISLSAGALFILVYRPYKDGGFNFLLGNHVTGAEGNIVLSHKKIGSNITIEFNPCGDFATYSSRNITLKTSTDSANDWDADIHFIALSLGGNKAQTGGSKNNSGWFEYFNSNKNSKLTTGQILVDNSFTGNSDTYSNSLTFAGWGDGSNSSSGFRMYEMLLFVPDANTTHNINADAAPFQPTDIIYKKIKDYIYNKYESLK